MEPTPPPPADLFDLDEAPPPPRRPPTLRELEDGGYDEGPLPERVTVGLPPREEADGKPGKGRKRKKRRGQGGESSTWERVQTGLLVVGLVGCLVILGLGLFVPGGRSIAVLLSFVAGLGMMMVGGIWSACVPFQESTRCGLMYLFVPFYAGYYTKTRFSEMFTPFLVNLSGGFLVYMATLGPLNQQGVEPGRGAQPVELGEEFEGGGWDEDEEVDQVEVGTNAMNPDAAGDVAAPPSLPPGSGGRRGRDDR